MFLTIEVAMVAYRLVGKALCRLQQHPLHFVQFCSHFLLHLFHASLPDDPLGDINKYGIWSGQTLNERYLRKMR